jgi:large subunit ribosomal protein L23
MSNLFKLSECLLSAVLTEKSTGLSTTSRYVFKVADWANKIQIRQAIETFFVGRKVLAVNTLNASRKKKRLMGRKTSFRKPYKKAYVTVVGEPIDFMGDAVSHV